MLQFVAHVLMKSYGIVQVVAAISKQLATLNTNSRYLHEGLCSYAEELTSTFPDPLSVSLSCTGCRLHSSHDMYTHTVPVLMHSRLHITIASNRNFCGTALTGTVPASSMT